MIIEITIYNGGTSIDDVKCLCEFAVDGEGSLLSVHLLGVECLDVTLVASVLLSHHRDVLAVEELRVAWCASLAYGLFEEEAVVVSRQDAGEALLVGDFTVLLQCAGDVRISNKKLCHNNNVLKVNKSNQTTVIIPDCTAKLVRL